MARPTPKCRGAHLCYRLTEAFKGRNIQGFVFDKEGRIVFRKSWNDAGAPIFYCPFCGVKIAEEVKR